MLLTIRNVAYFAVIFSFLPLGMAFAFVGVQMAVFGVYMGASFAPNHKGMPQIRGATRGSTFFAARSRPAATSRASA